MKVVTRICLIVGLLAGATAFALAQSTDPPPAGAPPAAAAKEQAEEPKEEKGLEQTALVITSKEVSAVQSALLSRGYYRERARGVLDAPTREAIRAFQADNGLEATGRIDRPTLARLDLPYPVTGKEFDSSRRNGMLPKIGNTVKDSTMATKNVVTGASRKVINGTQTGYEKTVSTGSAVVNRSKDVTLGAGRTTVNGAKTVGRKTQGMMQRTSSTMVGRSDDDIHAEVRNVLDADAQTRKFVTTVSKGAVTLRTTPGTQADLGAVVSGIRRINGVKSVFVVQP